MLQCPVCELGYDLSEDALGDKVVCHRCASELRVRKNDGGELYLHVLIEALDWQRAAAEAEEAAPQAGAESANHPKKPRLVTRRQKMRAMADEVPAERTARVRRTRGRRRV